MFLQVKSQPKHICSIQPALMREHKCFVIMWQSKLWREMSVDRQCPLVSQRITYCRGGVLSKPSQIPRFDGRYEWVTCVATPSVNAGEAK